VQRRAVSARERRSGPDDRYAGWQLAFRGGVAQGGWYDGEELSVGGALVVKSQSSRYTRVVVEEG
jgi:hypothetical protein